MTYNETYSNPAYKIARSMYLAIGGDPTKEFESVEEIYNDINGIFEQNSGRVVIEPLEVNVTNNGSQVFSNEEIAGYKPVSVNVDIPTGIVLNSLEYDKSVIDEITRIENERVQQSIDLVNNWDPTTKKLWFSDAVYFPSLGDNVGNVYWLFEKQLARSIGDNNFNSVDGPSDDVDSRLDGAINLMYAGNLSFNALSDVDYMFRDCVELRKVGNFTALNAVSAASLFTNDSKLETIGDLNLPLVENINRIFSGCNNLKEIPNMTLGTLFDVQQAFSNCRNITTIPLLDTSNCYDLSGLCMNCTNLKYLPLLDTSNCTIIGSVFSNCTSLEEIGGFKNLGMRTSLNGTSYNFLDKLPNIPKQSILNIFNNLYDRNSAGYSVVTIKLGATNLAKLTDEEKAIATNKGWTLI